MKESKEASNFIRTEIMSYKIFSENTELNLHIKTNKITLFRNNRSIINN